MGIFLPLKLEHLMLTSTKSVMSLVSYIVNNYFKKRDVMRNSFL